MLRRESAKRKTHARSARFVSKNGVTVLLEESHELALVDFVIALRTGSVTEPIEGLTRLTWKTLRMGTGKLETTEIEETIARLGGRLSIDVGTSFVRIQGSVIKRSLDPFFALVTSLLCGPAFRTRDLAQAKRETIADIQSVKDEDRALAGRHFRREVYGDHPYHRSVLGMEKSVRAIKRSDVERCYGAHFVAKNAVVAFAGDVSMPEVEALVSKHVSRFPAGVAPREKLSAPVAKRGRRVVIVDKPERTQTQIYVGGLGSKIFDPDHDALMIANTAFGGTFTARLMNEVRSKRGWSYGAYSRVGQDRERDTWHMWTFPAAKDAVACIALELELVEKLVERGISAKETRFAKSFLVNGHCFERDTAFKRLDPWVEVDIFGLPDDHPNTFEKRVRAVTAESANAAVRLRIKPDDLSIVLVATAKDVEADLAKLPGVSSVRVVKHDSP